MARRKDRQKALELRKQGKSYSQIREQLGVSKSTLSIWLRAYPLNDEQAKVLRGARTEKDYARTERFRETMKKKRSDRLSLYYEEGKKKLSSFSKNELFLAGLFLYWGEGNKASRNTLGVYNNDPSLMKFALRWYVESLDIPQRKIGVYLHLYSDMDIPKEIAYWENILSLPSSSFRKPYIKQSTRVGIDHKGFGHGTCGLVVHDTVIKEKILMALKVITDRYSL